MAGPHVAAALRHEREGADLALQEAVWVERGRVTMAARIDIRAVQIEHDPLAFGEMLVVPVERLAHPPPDIRKERTEPAHLLCESFRIGAIACPQTLVTLGLLVQH